MKTLHFHGYFALPDDFQIDAAGFCVGKAIILAAEHLDMRIKEGSRDMETPSPVSPGDEVRLRAGFERRLLNGKKLFVVGTVQDETRLAAIAAEKGNDDE